MNCNSLKITYPKLRILLLLKIYEAIHLEGEVRVTKCCADHSIKFDDDEKSRLLNRKDILKQVKKSTSIAAYRSSIALKIAAETQRSPTEIADQFVKHWDQIFKSPGENSSIEATLFSDLTVSVTQAGLLEFMFGDRAIAVWLQSLLDAQQEFGSLEQLQGSFSEHSGFLPLPQLFLCQTTHARCCSLLRWGNMLNVIVPLGGSVAWLTDFGKLRLKAMSELALIGQLVTTIDELEDTNAESGLKLAIDLSNTFQAFHRDCRIFGEIQVEDPLLAQSRLALVMITQRVLRQLLAQKIQVNAPDSL